MSLTRSPTCHETHQLHENARKSPLFYVVISFIVLKLRILTESSAQTGNSQASRAKQMLSVACFFGPIRDVPPPSTNHFY